MTLGDRSVPLGPPAAGRILMFGCGNMGGAMLLRWLAAGLDPKQVTVISPSERALPEGIRVLPYYDPVELHERHPGEDDFETIVLAIKPQQLRAATDMFVGGMVPRLLISILAGVDLARLEQVCATGMTLRAMPNLPVGIGKGVVALHANEDRDGGQRAIAEALMAPFGHVEWIADEKQFDLVTALAGSGPAFLFRFVDALADAGRTLGLPGEQACRLALATVEGAAAMAAAAAESPAKLADRVASPGGSTREGLNVLDADGALVDLLRRTLAASAKRNAELAAAARD